MTESRTPKRQRLLLVLAFALVVYVIVRAADTPQGDPPPHGKTSVSPSSPSAGSPTPSPSSATSSYDPADYAIQVRTRARQADVSAQLVMAILYNEAYKPHDPSFERAWQKYKPDAAFGIANMHRAAFDEVKRSRDFAGRRWDQLPDDRDLAIESEAWYLHDLSAQLPAHWTAPYTKSDLLALGYNAGPGNMLAFARGATPAAQARSYLDRLHTNWAKAGKAVEAS
ncbi:lytic transglycosylase domain-containing protein [Streptomyces misionensis]|uniref:Lytic transglycosylase domain-containing protein n=1 Tax=Streptomyces misionensis TaxID=67331 RepID=A0A5C6IWF3_9ACTN|nr:lytic transglycosylase domain-containing protein [Streptomyces misionensis]TWV33130.1 lytic transglycosylase domain-containing protein [Streptomyces misionensis]